MNCASGVLLLLTFNNERSAGSPTNYKFYWSYNATHITAAMEAHTKGWIAVGISTDGSMTSEFKGAAHFKPFLFC